VPIRALVLGANSSATLRSACGRAFALAAGKSPAVSALKIEADSGCDQQPARPNGRPQAPCSLT